MKQNYFSQPRADEDDELLKRCINEGHVPSSCLLGGVACAGAIKRGSDPCADCPGPRMNCQGRPFGGMTPLHIARHHQAERGRGQNYFFLGVDSAPSESQRSDDGALVGGVATLKRLPDIERGVAPTLSQNIADWNFDFVYAKRLTANERASARKYSGVIHQLHQRFAFEKIMLDPGGGGIWIARELKNHRQLIGGIETEVTPIGDQVNAPHELASGQFILNLYKRGDPGIETLWPHLAGDDMLNDAAYSILKEGFDAEVIGLPAEASYWFGSRKEEVQRWNEERQWCIKNLNALAEQLVKITVQTKETPDGVKQVFTKRNARIFEARGKKDLASAAML